MQKAISIHDAKLAQVFAQVVATLGLLTKGSKTQFTQTLLEVK